MVAIPTYLIFGDEQVNGPPIGITRPSAPTGIDPLFWAPLMHRHRFNRVVPHGSGATDANTGAGGGYAPYWDGQYPSGGAGAFVQYHYQAQAKIAGANGDAWMEGGGGISPTTMLMQHLFDKYGNTAPGFKLGKSAFTGGFGSYKPGGGGWLAGIAMLNAMKAAVGSDTLDIKVVIADASYRDLLSGNLNYKNDLQAFITGVRENISATCLIVIVNHHPDMFAPLLPPAQRTVRQFNLEIVAANHNVRLFDMAWASEWMPDALGDGAPSSVNTYYSTETYVQAGYRLGRFIDAWFAAAPVPGVGQGLATFVVIGDSQCVTAGMNPLLVQLGAQQSLLGDPGGTDRVGQWIWNNQTRQVELYDIVANATNFGSVTGNFGPESTLLKGTGTRFPDGRLVFKYGFGGVALTTEGKAAGATGAIEEGDGTIFEDIRDAWADCRSAVLRDVQRAADVCGILLCIGDNDTISDASAAAFPTELPRFIDDVRAVFGTRASGPPIPVVLLQPPPHADTAEGGSILGPAGRRATIRAAVAAMATARPNVRVILNSGASRFELQRGENIHYGAEAVFNIGYDAASRFVDMIDGVGGTAEETTSTLSEAAPFIVEVGTGLLDANSYATTEFADSYHAQYGNPAAWSGATQAAKEDALRTATRACDERYGARWLGRRATSFQALDWPRADVVDAAGDELGDSEIPPRLKQWVARAALLHIQGKDLSPATLAEATISSESKTSAGGFSKSVTYRGGKSPVTQFPALDEMLESIGYIGGGGGWGWATL